MIIREAYPCIPCAFVVLHMSKNVGTGSIKRMFTSPCRFTALAFIRLEWDSFPKLIWWIIFGLLRYVNRFGARTQIPQWAQTVEEDIPHTGKDLGCIGCILFLMVQRLDQRWSASKRNPFLHVRGLMLGRELLQHFKAQKFARALNPKGVCIVLQPTRVKVEAYYILKRKFKTSWWKS